MISSVRECVQQDREASLEVDLTCIGDLRFRLILRWTDARYIG